MLSLCFLSLHRNGTGRWHGYNKRCKAEQWIKEGKAGGEDDAAVLPSVQR